jgi:hypothetical protein
VRATLIVLLAGAVAAPALAEEPAGCDKFKWPLDKERALLSGDTPTVASGTSLAHALPVSVVVALKPFADAKLPTAPERAPKSPDSSAGFVEVPAPPHAGTYKVSLSAEAWIDVVQDGHPIKSAAFSGATGCEGIRKTVKFELAAQPFTIELSSVRGDSIRIAITAD